MIYTKKTEIENITFNDCVFVCVFVLGPIPSLSKSHAI